MSYTSLRTRFREWKTEFMQTLEIGKSQPVASSSPEWYAGLAVSPASFSRQLSDLQASLLQENRSQSDRVANAMRANMSHIGNVQGRTAGLGSQL